MFINNLPDSLSKIAKLFVDDISIFSVTHDIDISAIVSNEDLQSVS